MIGNAETLTTLALNADGVNLDYTDENGATTQINLGALVTAQETVTSLVQETATPTGVITYTNEAGTAQTANVVSANTDNAVKVGTDGGAYINANVKEVFSAEYAGATLYADGTDNLGMMTSDNTGPTGNYMNYYEWSSGEATPQDYDVIVRFTLPNDFTAWDATNPIVIDYQAEGSTTFSATMFLEDGTALGTIGASSSATWTTANLNPGAMTAGQTAVIILKLTGAAGDDTQKVRVGDITLNYKR
ncbi:conserved hypothetical protein [Tenacibaculum sediminilitoris]